MTYQIEWEKYKLKKYQKIKKYKNAVNTIENEEITTVLKRILMDEEKHLEIFTEFYEKYK